LGEASPLPPGGATAHFLQSVGVNFAANYTDASSSNTDLLVRTSHHRMTHTHTHRHRHVVAVDYFRSRVAAVSRLVVVLTTTQCNADAVAIVNNYALSSGG